MRNFEYKAVPAPTQGTKAKAAKTTEERYALSVTNLLNEMAEDGWEYVRAETLPCDERKGLTRTQTTYQNVLIFRRLKAGAQALPLEVATPRLASEPRPVVDSAPRRTSEPLRAVSETVAPRRVATRMAEESSAPPLGSARGDD